MRTEDNYTVFIVDKQGLVLKRDGSPRLGAQSRSEHRFPDFELARQFCVQVVSELPHVECIVYLGKRMVLQYFDAEWHRTNAERRRQMFEDREQRQRGLRGIWAIVGVSVLITIGLVILFVAW
jgi:hypothetical protein